jgi:hypothetical protein
MYGQIPGMNEEILFGNLPEGVLTPDHICIPGLPPMPRQVDEWQNWARLILVQREKVMQRCAQDAEEQRVQRALCRQPHGLGVAYFTIMFAWLYEPREEDDSTVAPFILYPRQAELLFALDFIMTQPKGPLSSLAIPKARGVGATWLYAVDDVWRFLNKRNYEAAIVSRTEDMVDSMGDPSSWMWKYDYLFRNLPSWLLPKGFSVERRPGNRCRTHMKILNPENGSSIIGEATSSGIGVGRRKARYGLDEFARLANGASIWGQLNETTNHRVAISTHNVDDSTDFWDMTHASNGWPEMLVFEMHWQAVITRDDKWLNDTRVSMKHDMFMREVMMDPWAGISSWVYPMARTLTPFYIQVQRELGPVLHCLDDGYDDEFAIVWTQHDPAKDRWIVLDGYTRSHQPIGYYGNLLRGQAVGTYDWDEEALRIMEWINNNQTWKGLYTGDRHGDNTDLTSGESAWGKLANDFGIHVLPNPVNLNTLKDRRDSLSEFIPKMQFADTSGAYMVLNALQNNRFPTSGHGSQATHEIRRPIHDFSSHPTTALEYGAVYLASRGSMGGNFAPRPPKNNRMLAGKDSFGRRGNQRVQTSW